MNKRRRRNKKGATYKCPYCNMVSHNPNDVKEGYCGNCHRYSQEPAEEGDPRIEPDYDTPCEVCGVTPTVPATGMCGPCSFGEAETAGGNW